MSLVEIKERDRRRLALCSAYGTKWCDTSAEFSTAANQQHHTIRAILSCTLAVSMATSSWITSWRSPYKYAAGALSAIGVVFAWQSNELLSMKPNEHRIFRLPLGVTVDVWADNFQRNHFWERQLFDCKTTAALTLMDVKVRLTDK